MATALVPLLLLFSPTAGAQSDTKKNVEIVAFDFDADGLKLDTGAANAQVIGTFEAAGGTVTFIDEGDSVSTLLIGGDAVLELANRARSLEELYVALAPRAERVPQAILVADAEREREGRALVFDGGASAGPTISEDFEVGDDDWAEGCSGDSDYDWNLGFEDWSDDGNFNDFPNDFSETDIFATDNATMGDINGYFGTLDAIWFGVCFAEGAVSSVQMQFRDYSTCYAVPAGFECGIWSPIPGTNATLSPGERYLYHNHSTYTSLRRGNVVSSGTAQYTGWTYFVSGAATDNFAGDDWYQAP